METKFDARKAWSGTPSTELEERFAATIQPLDSEFEGHNVFGGGRPRTRVARSKV
jgi:hypothetical protein